MSYVADTFNFVWNHPDNRSARPQAMARLIGWQLWERAARRPWTTKRLPGGMKLRCYPHSSAASAVIYCRYPEWEDNRFLLDYLRKGDVFLDVGANVGVFSLLAAAVPGAEIYAFEPSSDSIPRIEENFALNHLGGRAHVVAAAVGAEPGVIRVTTGLDSVNIVIPEGEDVPADSGPVEEVRLTTLDTEFDADVRSRVALIKMDIEGYEHLALRGGSALLREAKPALILEAHGTAARDQLRDVLEPLDYALCSYDPHDHSLREIGWYGHRHPNVLAIADVDAARERLGARA